MGVSIDFGRMDYLLCEAEFRLLGGTNPGENFDLLTPRILNIRQYDPDERIEAARLLDGYRRDHNTLKTITDAWRRPSGRHIDHENYPTISCEISGLDLETGRILYRPKALIRGVKMIISPVIDPLFGGLSYLP